MSLGITSMSPWKLVLSSLSLNSISFNSQKFRQTGVFPQNTNPKRLNFLCARHRWRGDLPTVLPSLLFVLLLCQLGPIESWIYTNQMLKCYHYVIDFFVVVNVTLMLLVCAVALTCPRSHFTDVQPTDADYSDRWCAWGNLLSHLEEKAVCDYWSVLCCFNLF